MRCFGTLAFAFLAVAAGPVPAWAFGALDSNSSGQHQIELRYADSQPQPYAMNYVDEAARTLGIREGQWEALPRSSNMPSLMGSIKSGRPMLILQWRPGK
jgi:hypothetical protein